MRRGPDVLFSVALVVGWVAPASAQTEQPPRLAAGEVLPGVPLHGPGYTIAPIVINDGAINTFTITVDGHAYQVRGNALVRERLGELAALRQLQALKGTEVYKQALEKAATGPLRPAKNMVTAPIDTLEGMGRGIGTFFTNLGHAAFGGASEQESGVLKTAIGFDAAKRQFAYRVGVDPYTTFAPVADQLSDLAWAAVAGGLTVSVFAAIPGTAGSVMSGTKTGDAMNRLVRDNTPAELKKINAGKL
jgi:hypothetical protein